MIVKRWQASQQPALQQIVSFFTMEGLDPIEENYPQGYSPILHQHPFDEVRVVVDGELIVDVAGNQLLLRSGDRLEIPSNTKHQLSTKADLGCKSLYAKRLY